MNAIRNNLLLTAAILIGLLMTSYAVAADEKGFMGFGAKVSVSGIFSPKLSEVLVEQVVPDSPAQVAGMEVGNKIMAIDGCQVPGCPASEAKALMNRKPGDILHLVIEDAEGEQRAVEIHVR